MAVRRVVYWPWFTTLEFLSLLSYFFLPAAALVSCYKVRYGITASPLRLWVQFPLSDLSAWPRIRILRFFCYNVPVILAHPII